MTLPIHWVNFLKSQPETGMGYQTVNLVLDNGARYENVNVFNCESIFQTLGLKPSDMKHVADIEMAK